MSDNGSRSTREQAVATLRDHDKFLLTTHERPDGDAVGSLAAMQQVLVALGKDAVAFLTADEFPLPYEYRFIRLEGLVTEPPADLSERIMVFLDCGNVDRTPAAALKSDGRCILNIDHHHDNTRFGTLNHVDPRASCTAEMVWDLMKGLEVQATQPIAEALYVGVVTDTGRFMYENTGSRAHEMAACSRSRTSRSRTTSRPAPTRATPRAWSTTCARSRARRSRGSCASCCPTRRRRAARSRCAPPTTASTCP
jgi:bifunctional oligoribonuclease and PAP phosphatase NrnA